MTTDKLQKSTIEHDLFTKKIEMPCGEILTVTTDTQGNRSYSANGFTWNAKQCHRTVLQAAVLEEDYIRYSELNNKQNKSE